MVTLRNLEVLCINLLVVEKFYSFLNHYIFHIGYFRYVFMVVWYLTGPKESLGTLRKRFESFGHCVSVGSTFLAMELHFYYSIV